MEAAEEEHDEQYYIEQAIKLSLQLDEEAQTKQEGDKPAEKQDLKDIVTTDFMKDVISDLNLDIDPS